MDELLVIEYVGGPLDGQTWECRRSDLSSQDPADWGAYMIVDGHKTPPGGPDLRAVYEPDPPPADPTRWIYRGWVP